MYLYSVPPVSLCLFSMVPCFSGGPAPGPRLHHHHHRLRPALLLQQVLPCALTPRNGLLRTLWKLREGQRFVASSKMFLLQWRGSARGARLPRPGALRGVRPQLRGQGGPRLHPVPRPRQHGGPQRGPAQPGLGHRARPGDTACWQYLCFGSSTIFVTMWCSIVVEITFPGMWCAVHSMLYVSKLF